jgi:hypothetical protein
LGFLRNLDAVRSGKIRAIDLEELESWDDLGLIETILRLDFERVATAG